MREAAADFFSLDGIAAREKIFSNDVLTFAENDAVSNHASNTINRSAVRVNAR
jgi:hypothetical protein